MTRMTEAQLAALLARTGTPGAPNVASTANPPFLPGDSVTIDLPMCPSTNHLFFNNKRGGRVKTPEYQDWIDAAGWHLAIQKPPGIPGKVKLLIEVAEPETRRRQDCTNRIKAVEDLLVLHSLIEGDDQRFVREVAVKWAPIKGIRVTITPL
jgi:Holliday junction resolvase RusA-like endonuclease